MWNIYLNSQVLLTTNQIYLRKQLLSKHVTDIMEFAIIIISHALKFANLQRMTKYVNLTVYHIRLHIL